MKFSEWKTITMRKLITLSHTEKYASNMKAKNDLNVLATKLQYLRSRDLASFLYLVHVAIRDTGITELLEIIPSEEDLIDMLKEDM